MATSLGRFLLGEYSLVEKQEILAAVTDVTFAGLDGDADGIYMLQSSIVPVGAGPNSYDLYPNGLSTNQSGTLVGLQAAYAHSVIARLRIGSTFGANHSYGVAHFWARKAGPGSTALTRHLVADWSVGDSGFRGQGVWSDSSANVTSIVIHGDPATEIGIGSTFALYKLRI